jgi:hypothetical protein
MYIVDAEYEGSASYSACVNVTVFTTELSTLVLAIVLSAINSPTTFVIAIDLFFLLLF